MAFNVPSANTTVATKGPTMTKAERYRVEQGIVRAGQSAQASRVKARTIPVNRVRTVPVDEKQDTKKSRTRKGCRSVVSRLSAR